MTIKKCVVCLREFECYDYHRGARAGNKRRSNCITCSKKCARIYNRVYEYIREKIRVKQRQDEKNKNR